VFKNKKFLNRQREIINAVKAKRDTIALIPTGHGKSLTFQLPAITDKGITFVIMPLLSLIEDQVNKLSQLGIKTVFIHSTNNISDILKRLRSDEHEEKIFFMTPEQLMNNEALQSIMKNLYERNMIERFVIDEIHCLLSWGKDFRLDYLKLCSIRTLFPKVPILGLTATATPEVIEELKKKLKLNNSLVFSISFNRDNLYYEAIPMRKKDRKDAVRELLLTKFKNLSGIVYTATLKEWETLWSYFKYSWNIKCGYYHGRMEIEKRVEIQNQWKDNEIDVIVATIAFGMGIDKKDVRFVVHMSLPKSLDGYIQEWGRAGRDGRKELNDELETSDNEDIYDKDGYPFISNISHWVLFYDYSDRDVINWFIKNNETDQEREHENKNSL